MEKILKMEILPFGMISTDPYNALFAKLLILILFISGLFTACDSRDEETTAYHTIANEETVTHNMLTEEEKQQGWILLFDGETTNGWRGYNQNDFPSKWIVSDGTLFFNSARTGSGGDIIYDQKFHNFRLSLEWKISEGGNSGIFYLGQETEGEPIWRTAPEMQILDNERHPDASRGVDGNRKAGALYDLIPANPQNTRPAGEWNHAEVMVHNGNVVHYQNGEPVVEYQLGTPAWDRMIADSKFSDLPEFGIDRPGYIALQDHRDDVWFRNIKILPMD